MTSINLKTLVLTVGLLLLPLGANSAEIKVLVEPVAGAPSPLDQRLADLVSEEIENSDLSSMGIFEADVEFTLRGRAKAKSGQQGTTTVIDWTVLNPSDSKLLELQVEDLAPFMAAGDPWDAIDLGSLKRLAITTARQFEKSIDKVAIASLSATAVGDEVVGSEGKVFIESIVGAPGDGNELLEVALAEIMRQYRFSVVPTLQDDSYVIRGKVSSTATSTTTELVRIEWKLLGPNGEIYGQIEQDNEVGKAEFEKSWGETAVFAAAGAGDGLIAIMRSLGSTPPKVTE